MGHEELDLQKLSGLFRFRFSYASVEDATDLLEVWYEVAKSCTGNTLYAYTTML